jgi:hypothetical protein
MPDGKLRTSHAARRRSKVVGEDPPGLSVDDAPIRRSAEFQWFLTLLSERPGRHFAISDLRTRRARTRQGPVHTLYRASAGGRRTRSSPAGGVLQ